MNNIEITLENLNFYIKKLNNINEGLNQYQELENYDNLDLVKIINLKEEASIIFEKINIFLSNLIENNEK
jgi:hypothetical protein